MAPQSATDVSASGWFPSGRPARCATAQKGPPSAAAAGQGSSPAPGALADEPTLQVHRLCLNSLGDHPGIDAVCGSAQKLNDGRLRPIRVAVLHEIAVKLDEAGR